MNEYYEVRNIYPIALRMLALQDSKLKSLFWKCLKYNTFFDPRIFQYKHHKRYCEYTQNKVGSQPNILEPTNHISMTFSMRTDSFTNIGGMVIIMTWLAMYEKFETHLYN